MLQQVMSLPRVCLYIMFVAELVLGAPKVRPGSQPRLCVAPIPEEFRVDQNTDVRCIPGNATSLTSPFGEALTLKQDLWSTSQYSLEFWFAQQVQRSPLMVADCQQADVVYIPLMTLWAGCAEDQEKKVNEFTKDIASILPLLSDKPHFLTIARVLAFSAVDTHALISKGISIFTIEGDPTNPAVIEVPYPAAYHQHAGSAPNVFIEYAMKNKSQLAFQCFGLEGHTSNDLEWRTALHQACLAAGEDCTHAIPRYDGDENKEFIQEFWHNASSSWYCLQPTGHSVTRKSTFECLLAGSIPVFFDTASIHHFPWSDYVDAHELVLVLNKDVKDLHYSLAQTSLEQRQTRIQRIAAMSHLYQYSLDPQSRLIDWHNIHQVDRWDDAFTFALKTLLRRVQAQGLLK